MQNILQLFETMCHQFFRKESALFTTQNTFLDAFRRKSRTTIGRNPLMVIPSLANQDLTPMLIDIHSLPKTKFENDREAKMLELM